jgi:hypothetical protein
LGTPEAGAGSMTVAPASMLRGFVLFGDDFTDVRLVAAIASAWHPRPALTILTFRPKRDRGDFRTPTLRQNKWGRFYPCKRLSIVARWLLVGLFFVQGFLQFPLCLQIELLVPALGLTGLLPKFIRAADNIYSGRPCHDRFPYSSS